MRLAGASHTGKESTGARASNTSRAVVKPQESIPEESIEVFIALSRFVVANDTTDEVKIAFLKRPHLVDSAPGFLRLEVLSPQDDPNEIWLLTYWTEEAHYRSWHRSHEYHESHKGIPKGLKLVPKSAEIRFFDHVAS